MDGSVLEAQRDDAHTLVAVHDQVQSEVLDEVVAVVLQGLPVQGVQQRVPWMH